MVAIIGGESSRFAPLVDLYHRALERFERPELPVGVHSPGHVADTDEEAREQLWPPMKRMRDRIGAERGWGPMGRAEFDRQAGPDGSLYVGAPETVARKIAATVRILGLNRFDMKYSAGHLPHEAHDAQHRALRHHGDPHGARSARHRLSRTAAVRRADPSDPDGQARDPMRRWE